MIPPIHDRRRARRIFFSVKDRITAEFQLPPPRTEPVTGNIMDISPDGIGITLERADATQLKQGDHLMLTSVRNIRVLSFLQGLEMEIRWVLDHRSLSHIGLGCQFIEITEETRERIRGFMETYAEQL
ncbi:MAG: PilZ domain-containing protein [Desulfococcaceae bacterium]